MARGKTIVTAVALLAAGSGVAMVCRKPTVQTATATKQNAPPTSASESGKGGGTDLLGRISLTTPMPDNRKIQDPEPAPHSAVPPTASIALGADAHPAQVAAPALPKPVSDAVPAGSQIETAAQAKETTAPAKEPPTLADDPPPAGEAPMRTGPRLPTTHKVRDGDTLATIAKRYLGSADRAAEIFEANRNVLDDPELLPIGVTLQIGPAAAAPPASEKVVPFAPLVDIPPSVLRKGTGPSTRLYRVAPGDTLVKLSQRFYGTAERYQQLYQANLDRLENPSDLRPGTLLVVPNAE